MPWFGSGKSDKPAAAAPAAGEEEHHDDEPAVGEVKYDPAKQTKVPRIDTGVPPANHTLRLGGETSSYDYVDARHFVVRGPNYLKDKKKQPSKPSAFELVEVSGFSSTEKTRFTTERTDSYYSRARASGRKNFIFVMHFDLNPMHTVMTYEMNPKALEEDPAFAKTFKRWLEGDDAYKNRRIKLITSVVDANWVVRKTIGKPVPALIGNKLTCYYRQTEDMIECTCDVNSSVAAAAILTVVKGACKGIVCDLVLLIESQEEDELPERIIGGTRYIHHDLSGYLVRLYQDQLGMRVNSG